jgi:CPA1 family monovalent cation:H+ antiporter
VNSFDLKPFPMLAEFTDEDREALAELLEERTVWEGRAIFREGEEADGLVLIASGAVRLESSRGVELNRLGAGSSFGGVSLLVLGQRECTVVAETECAVLCLARTSYRRLMDDAPRTACRLMEAVVNAFVGSIAEDLDRIVEVLTDPD